MCSLFTSRSDIHCKELDPVPVPFNTSCCILRLCSHTVTVILSSKQLQLLLSQVSPSSRFVSATDMTDFGFASALTGLVNGWKWSSPIAVSVQNPVQISVHSPVHESSPESRVQVLHQPLGTRLERAPHDQSNGDRVCLSICRTIDLDIIDYVTGIGNSSREQYTRAGQSVSH